MLPDPAASAWMIAGDTTHGIHGMLGSREVCHREEWCARQAIATGPMIPENMTERSS
jgi:hypothetical protein